MYSNLQKDKNGIYNDLYTWIHYSSGILLLYLFVGCYNGISPRTMKGIYSYKDENLSIENGDSQKHDVP